ncbi:hypothetical protein DLM75_19845 [Leptospira stimsonii]|uniref:Uncharacterized protein n=1 Tax=Leptospira stimsonii TaxID=2202203 RepID=A0A396YWG4_9LEPT|nr:hypothetical protein DLM75_19845 [Leptospira stimsonii]
MSLSLFGKDKNLHNLISERTGSPFATFFYRDSFVGRMNPREGSKRKSCDALSSSKSASQIEAKSPVLPFFLSKICFSELSGGTRPENSKKRIF